MYYTPNAPVAVRNWAICKQAITGLKESCRCAENGLPGCYASAVKLKMRGPLKPDPAEIRRLKRKIRHYSCLLERLEKVLPDNPENYLLTADELISLVGTALKWYDRRNRRFVFETITHVSSCGTAVFSANYYSEQTSMDLLVRGYASFFLKKRSY